MSNLDIQHRLPKLPKTQKYTMRKRAEQVEQTRLQITEAAVRLHTTVGPAKTTISAVAEEAEVTRVTVYRHFPDEEALFFACRSHWEQLHPGPDPTGWLTIDGLEARARHALGELYAFYRTNHSDLYPIFRDFETMPEATQELMTGQRQAMSNALITGAGARGGRRRRQLAIAGHLTSFWTWWSLAIDAGLDDQEIVDLAAGFLSSV